jgi:RHS repeat-associated protein
LEGAPVAVIEGGVVYFIRTDHIGRPAFATDSTGAKLWEVSYLPFGGVHVSSGLPIALRFPGQWFQAESGLHQNWMRDYDPTTGRYIEADPLGLVDGPSVYGYARQNPGRWVDPRGEYISVVDRDNATYFDRWEDCVSENSPLSVDDIEALFILGGPIPKKSLGVRVQPGSSPFTSLPSYTAHQMYGSQARRTGLGSAMRSAGRAGSLLLLMYGAYMLGVELRCGCEAAN